MLMRKTGGRDALTEPFVQPTRISESNQSLTQLSDDFFECQL